MRLYQKCLLPFVLLLVSCQSTDILMTATSVQPLLSTSTPSVLQPPTSTSLGDITPTASIQPPPENVLEYRCLEIASDLPITANMTGRLILDDGQPYSFDFDTRTFRTIPPKSGDFAVSPNGKWLAYFEISDDSPTGAWLIIENSDGVQKKVPQQPDWFLGIRWLDNLRFVYNVWDRKAVIPIYPMAVINPFSGAKQVLASDYPNLVPKILGMAGTPHFVYSTVVYDSSLNLVVYPETNSEGDFVVLWDRQSRVALAKLHDQNNFGHTPLWLPDESGFVIAVSDSRGNNDWFAISRDGKIRQLTHFGESLAESVIDLASFSPNGRYLAFWLEVKPSSHPGYNLAVLDMETQHITDYCIPGLRGAIEDPVWSPDNEYFVISSEIGTNVHQVVLIAPFEGWAAKIADDFTPRGWMKTSP